MERYPSDSVSGDDSHAIAKAVYEGIAEEDFASSAVDALLSIVQGGNCDVLGDVLAYLTSNKHPDWAAELCRLVMAGPGGAAHDVEHRDYASVATALSHMVATAPLQVSRELCTFIMEMKDDGNGSSYFDCTDLGQVLGQMVQEGNAVSAGQILYDIYCDGSPQGQAYQVLVPYVLGGLVDRQCVPWAVELSKQLMYADGDRSIDYSVMGWAMMQMVYYGRANWAAAICAGLRDQRLRWFNQQEMYRAVAAYGGPSYPQAISHFLDYGAANGQGYSNGHYGHQSGGRGLNAAMQRMNIGGQQGGYRQQQQQGGGGYQQRQNQYNRQQHQASATAPPAGATKPTTTTTAPGVSTGSSAATAGAAAVTSSGQASGSGGGAVQAPTQETAAQSAQSAAATTAASKVESKAADGEQSAS